MKKKKPTIKKLPKYYNGDTFVPQDMNQPINGNLTEEEYYQQQQSNQLNNATTSTLMSVGKGLSAAPSNVDGSMSGANKIGNSMGWLGYATAASDLGKSFIPKNADGTAKTANGASANRQMTATHTQALNAANQGNYGQAAINLLGGGNLMQMVDSTGLLGNSKLGKMNQKMLDEDYQYPMGGTASIPNAEVELQENSISPTGEFTQYNGPSHEQGGKPVNLEPGEIIFSDRLKMPGTKKTFAELNKSNNTKKQDKVLEDSYATSTAKSTAKLVADIKRKKSEQLFATQEALKQAKVQAYAKKMGLNTDTFAMGGIKKYWAGGTEDGEPTDPIVGFNSYTQPGAIAQPVAPNAMYTQADIDAIKNSSAQAANDDIVNQAAPGVYWDPNTKSFNRFNSNGQSIKDRQFGLNNVVPQDSYKNIADPTTQGQTKRSPEYTPSGNKFNPRELAGAGFGAGVQSIDELMYLKDHGKRYDKVDYGTVTPEKLNPREAILQAQMQARITRNALKDQTGGNVGSYLSNLTGAQAVNSMNIANIRQQYDNQNAGIANQAKYANQGYKMQGMADEAANKGQALTNYYQAIGEIGNNTAGAYTDYKKGKMDQNTAKMLGSMFTNWGLDMNDPNHWTIFYKKYQEQNKVPNDTEVPANPNMGKTKYGRSMDKWSLTKK